MFFLLIKLAPSAAATTTVTVSTATCRPAISATTMISTATTLAATMTTTTFAAMTTTMTMIAMIPIPTVPTIAQATFLTTDEIRVQISLRQYLTFADPHLDTDLPIYRQRKYIRIIDIHPQRMQRSTALLDLLRTGDLGATQTAAHLDLDPFCSHTKSRRDRHLDSPLVVDTVLDLTSNRITDYISIQLRSTNFKDVDLDIVFTRELLQLFLDPVDLATTFTDDDTGLGSMDRHDQLVQRALDNDLGDPSFIDTGVQVGSDLVVLDQLGSIVFLAAIPVGFPTADDP